MENLAVCPPEICAVDHNAAELWPIFLRKVGLHFNAAGEIIENDGHLADVVRRFGVPSLAQRLAGKTTERDRARVWWREATACSPGESDIPDIAEKNAFVLNPFIISAEEKFPDPRAARLADARQTFTNVKRERGRPVKSDIEKRATNALRHRAHRASKRNVLFAA